MLGLLIAALGARACEPMDEVTFRSYVLDAQAAIDRGDIELPEAILSELSERLPCLTFPPAPRMWADLLVAEAIVEFSRGGDWVPPMAAALRIRPRIDRGVGAGHPLATWEPPPLDVQGPLAPPQAEFYVDGLPTKRLPPDQGLWLVQKTDGRFWNTLVLQDEPLPESWITEPVIAPPRLVAWVRGGIVIGGGGITQSDDWGSDLYLTYRGLDRPELLWGGAADLQLTFFSPFGVLAQGIVPWSLDGFSGGGRIHGVWTLGGLSLGAGIGSSLVATYEGDLEEPRRRPRPMRYGSGIAMFRSSSRSGWDVALSGGLSAALARYEVSAGLLLPPIQQERFRLSVLAYGHRARFTQTGLPDRRLTSSVARFLLRLDWVWGNE
ncbi:MAG TPA: hypothetical protein ENK18_24900 [Deltaproteobacteria bacterium]|nr:hypothetical protein [Deltaproteobacteria bacterium]